MRGVWTEEGSGRRKNVCLSSQSQKVAHSRNGEGSAFKEACEWCKGLGFHSSGMESYGVFSVRE